MIDVESFVYQKFKKANKLKRFEHEVRVKYTALNLVRYYQFNIDEELVKKACFLHDYAKIYDDSYLLLFIQKLNLDPSIYSSPAIWHGLVGYQLYLRDSGDEYNKDIDEAIKMHTIGGKEMSLLAKILFIADYIEPDRAFETCQTAKNLAYRDLDQAIEYILEQTIIHLQEKNCPIYRDTIDNYQYFKELNKQKEKICLKK